MVELYQETGSDVIAVQECDPAETHKYGIVGRGEDVHNGYRTTGMVEKPKSGSAPSNLCINGRYILQPDIFEVLRHQEGEGRQRDPTDRRDAGAAAALLRLPRKHLRLRPEGFIEANVAFALWRPHINRSLADTIEALLRDIRPVERRAVSR